MKAAWDWFILLLVIYVAVFTPYVAAFDRQRTAPTNNTFLSDPFVVSDLIVDAMFMADMLINFRTTYMHNGEVVVIPKRIAINYLRTWFIIDAVSAIPFDLILTTAGASCEVCFNFLIIL